MEVDAWVLRSRVAKSLAFVDLVDATAAPDDVVLQAVFNAEAFEGALATASGQTGTSTAAFGAYVAMCKPGARLRLRGEAEAGGLGEPALRVRRAALLAAAPDWYAVARAVLEAQRGALDAEEVARALLLSDEAWVTQLFLECGPKLSGPLTDLRHALPKAAASMRTRADVLRKSLPPEVAEVVFRPRRHRQGRGLQLAPPPQQAADTAAAAATAWAAGAQKFCTVSEAVTLAEGLHACIPGSSTAGALQGGFFLVCVVGQVHSRCRLGGNATVLALGNDVQNGVCNSTAQVKLRVVLHPSFFGVYQTDGGEGAGTSGAQANQPTLARIAMYSGLCARSSRVRVTGVLHSGALYANDVQVERCSWRTGDLAFAVDVAADGSWRAAEAARALGLNEGEDTVASLANSSTTERRWLAAEASARLQGPMHRETHVSKASADAVVALSGFRSRWPVVAEADAVDEPTKRETEHFAVVAQPVARSPRVGVEGSWWSRSKRPQLEWVAAVVERIVRRHPAAGRRPLRIFDVGGGKGHLSALLAANLGEGAATLTVLELSDAMVSRGRRSAANMGLQNLNFEAGDASQTSEEPDIVVALHACGALSDVALEAWGLALARRPLGLRVAGSVGGAAGLRVCRRGGRGRQ